MTVSPWVACLVALAIAFVVACLIGYPALRLKGHYLAMATLGFGLIVYRVVLGTAALGAADGLSDVPAFALAPGLKIAGAAAHRLANY